MHLSFRGKLALLLFGIFGLLLAGISLWESGPVAAQRQGPGQLASTSNSQERSGLTAVDAYAHWVVNGSSPSEITVTVGSRLVLDLYINSGTNTNIATQQSYLTFTNSLLQVVNATQAGCVITSTLTPDLSTFEATLQNEVCNGPGVCNFRGMQVTPGSIAFASGALTNCP